jgi:hypothetical protein
MLPGGLGGLVSGTNGASTARSGAFQQSAGMPALIVCDLYCGIADNLLDCGLLQKTPDSLRKFSAFPQ